MGNEPNSVGKMKKYYFNRLAVPTQEDMLAELLEGNDRSAIVTVGSILDAALTAAIADRLPNLKVGTEADFDEAFGFNGPIGTFSAKIEIAFYLAAIDATVRGQLHTVRAMRNVCAHSRQRVSFAHPELANVARRFFHPTGAFKLHSETPDGFKKTLVAEGMFLYQVILTGRDEALQQVRASYAAQGCESPI